MNKNRKVATSQQIVEYLKKNQRASALDLSIGLGMTKSAITYHLRKLCAQKILSPVAKIAEPKRGRPQLLFQISLSSRTHNYQDLCAALLRLMENSELKTSGYHLLGGYLSEGILGAAQMLQKLNRLTHSLNRYGYQASWIAHLHGPQLIFKECPYAALVDAFPGLCRMDQALLSETLSLPVTQIQKINLEAGIAGACRFTIYTEPKT